MTDLADVFRPEVGRCTATMIRDLGEAGELAPGDGGWEIDERCRFVG